MATTGSTESTRFDAQGTIGELLGRTDWPNECVTWGGSRNKQGYPQAKIDGKTTMLCRWLLTQWEGSQGKKYQAAHECGKGNEGCVNRAHLSWKTAAENNADKRRHGTFDTGFLDPSYDMRTSPRRSLSDGQVREIRRLRREGLSYRAIGEAVGCSKDIAHQVVKGLSYANVV